MSEPVFLLSVLLNAIRMELVSADADRSGGYESMDAAPKRIEELLSDLQNSEHRYRRLFEAAQDGILILDAETGRIIDANPFLLESLGYTHAELLGKHLW